MKKLSEILHIKRIDRPDEWSMDDFSRQAKKLEKRIAELENTLSKCERVIKVPDNEASADDYDLGA